MDSTLLDQFDKIGYFESEHIHLNLILNRNGSRCKVNVVGGYGSVLFP